MTAPAPALPVQVETVVIGAGIVGSSAAWFLAERGFTDTLVIDQGELFEGPGSSSHAPGLVFQNNALRTVCRLARQSVELYASLSWEGEPCYYPVGSLEIAYSVARREELKRKAGHSLSWGLPAAVIESDEIRERLPVLAMEGVLGALWTPGDGVAKAVRICRALGARAAKLGVRFNGHTRVTGITVEGGHVRAIQTNRGCVTTRRVLVCAGLWGPVVGQMAGVRVPLMPVEHQYVRTGSVPALSGETREIAHPILRHQDRSMYFRQHRDCYGIGSYQHEPRLACPFGFQLGETAKRPFTGNDFCAPYEDALRILPCLQEAPLAECFNGMFSFTPDGNSIVGESADVKGFWLAEAVWVTHGGGVGRAVADWIAHGDPGMDLHELDCNRFQRHASTRRYLEVRAAQQYREVYDIIHPAQSPAEPRPLRTSPFYARQQSLGAVFFESGGWERPQWFKDNGSLPADQDWPVRRGWAARFWSPIIGREHKAVREGVGLFDLTPFTKIEVSGRGAVDYLERVCANRVGGPVGGVCYTALLTDQGGMACDVTVTRLESERFMVVTGSTSGPLDTAWIRAGLPADGSVEVRDRTEESCCLGIWGPAARALVQALTRDDVSNAAFPYRTARPFEIGCLPVFAIRISYAGELGWEIYAPNAYGLALWDALWHEGRAHGLVAAGAGALDSLRLEKGYRLWGVDIHTEYNPFEAGLGFAVRRSKGDFRGRDALERAVSDGIRRKLCCLVFDDPNVAVMGKEPVLNGSDVVGHVTSANYGYAINRSIAYAYLPLNLAAPGTSVEVLYFGSRYSARVAEEPLFDPGNQRLKA